MNATQIVNATLTIKEQHFMCKSNLTLAKNLGYCVRDFIQFPTEEKRDKFLKNITEIRKIKVVNAWFKSLPTSEQHTIEWQEKNNTSQAQNHDLSPEKVQNFAESVRKKVEEFSKRQLK